MRLKHDLAAWLSIAALSCSILDRSTAEPMTWPCQGRCFDAAWISNKGFAYFLKGDQFWRYDIVANRVGRGEFNDDQLKVATFVYPRPMKVWSGLPQSWLNGINAALNGGDGKVYWFKGREYVRLDIGTGKVDAGPQPIASQWPALPPAWSASFDAAINWGNGRIIFFKGREALSYDLATGKAAEPRPIADVLRGFPAAWSDGIDTIVNWGNGKAYIFKREQYLRYDIASDKVDLAPRPIATNWPGLMQLIEWVNWPTLKMPDDAMSVGREGNTTHFLCAVMDGNAIYPGKLWSENKSCYYADGPREVKTGVYAAATTKLPITWTTKESAPSDRLIPVGNSPTGQPYYLCRARYDNGVHPGRIEALSGACTITYYDRSYALSDGVEIAIAPTTVNPPVMPHRVRMLSPLAGSERFKDVCAAEVTHTIRGKARQGNHPPELPDVKTMLQTISRNVCSMFYKNPGQVPKYARKIELFTQDSAGVYVHRSDSSSQMVFDQWWLFPGMNYIDQVATFYHETAHTAQHSSGSGPLHGPFLEGAADYIRNVKVWGSHVTKAGGDPKDGYSTVAFFLDWLEHRYPEFVYRYNMSLSSGSRPTAQIVRQLTGRPLDALWQDYQNSLPATIAWPESSLRWSPPKATPLVQAQSQSVKALFEKHGLLGKFAVDCAKPPDRQNFHLIYRVLDDNRVQREMMSGPKTLESAFVIDRAAESKPNEFSFGGTINGKRYNMVSRVEGRRIRLMESIREPDAKLVIEGRVLQDGRDTNWFSWCGR